MSGTWRPLVENLHHFKSNQPWASYAVLTQVWLRKVGSNVELERWEWWWAVASRGAWSTPSSGDLQCCQESQIHHNHHHHQHHRHRHHNHISSLGVEGSCEPWASSGPDVFLPCPPQHHCDQPLSGQGGCWVVPCDEKVQVCRVDLKFNQSICSDLNSHEAESNKVQAQVEISTTYHKLWNISCAGD